MIVIVVNVAFVVEEVYHLIPERAGLQPLQTYHFSKHRDPDRYLRRVNIADEEGHLGALRHHGRRLIFICVDRREQDIQINPKVHQ